MASSTRESRRRKILERGSDRLALITDQVQNLPPHPRDQTDVDRSPPLVPHDQDPPPNFSRQAAASSNAHDQGSTPVLLKHDPGRSQTSAYNGGTGEGSVSHRGRTTIEPSKDPVLDASGEVNSLPVSLDDQSSFISTSEVVPHSETQSRQHNLFTHKQISSAIDASEKTRFLCSVVVAILVLLSHLGFPFLGNRFLGSIISLGLFTSFC
ncbi:hypothetical protein DITRI_Ditri10aG0121400 [Diplodiscus trichospermus]